MRNGGKGDKGEIEQSVTYTVHDGVYHTPLRRFPKLDSSATKRVPIPNGTSSESSRREVSNAELFGTDTISTMETSTMENRPWGVARHRRIQVRERVSVLQNEPSLKASSLLKTWARYQKVFLLTDTYCTDYWLTNRSDSQRTYLQ